MLFISVCSSFLKARKANNSGVLKCHLIGALWVEAVSAVDVVAVVAVAAVDVVAVVVAVDVVARGFKFGKAIACVFVFPTTVQRKDVAAVELVEVWWLSKFASYGEISGLIPATYIFFILKWYTGKKDKNGRKDRHNCCLGWLIRKLCHNNKTMVLFRCWNLRKALDADRWCQIRSPSCWNLVEILGLGPEPFWSDPTHCVIPFLTKPRRNNETPTEFFSNENIYCNQIICMS